MWWPGKITMKMDVATGTQRVGQKKKSADQILNALETLHVFNLEIVKFLT
jgi:hypothetical protein